MEHCAFVLIIVNYYRKLNAVTKPDSYQKLRMDKCIESVGEAAIFSAMDANSGYWQVEIGEADRDKTAFTSHQGLCRFIRMSLGLRNALGTFQHKMDVILSTVRCQFALVYLGDVVIFSRSSKDHIGHHCNVLILLCNACATLKLKSRWFLAQKINYLEHVIRSWRLGIASHAKNAINGLQHPANPTKLCSFLGLCNVFRPFVSNLAHMAAHLKAKLRKDQPETFRSLKAEEIKSMKLLKDALVSSLVLELQNSSVHIPLDTEACDVQVGCVLLQTQHDNTTNFIRY